MIAIIVAVATFTQLHEKRDTPRYKFRSLVIVLSLVSACITWLSAWDSHQNQIEQSKRLATANDKIVTVEAETAPRGLTDTQKIAFRTLLQSSVERVSLSYVVGQGSGDSRTLIADMLTEAHAAGAKIGSTGMSLGVFSSGITFEFNSMDTDTISRLITFAQTIEMHIHGLKSKFVPVGNITVDIGSRVDGSL